MSQEEVAKRLGMTRTRVQQVERAALAKMHVLAVENYIDRMEPRELRLVIVQARNALAKQPRHPAEVAKEFMRRESSNRRIADGQNLCV